MKDQPFSSSTRALLDAAKKDAPGRLAKAKMWGGVAASTGLPGGALTALAGVPAKLLAVGALLGTGVTVGVTAVLLWVAPTAPSPDARASAIVAPSRDSFEPAPSLAPVAPLAAAAPPRAEPVDSKPSRSLAAHVRPEVRAAPPTPLAKQAPPEPPPVDENAVLAREAQLVRDARAALARGDAASARSLVRTARALETHALEPEELALEARAARALGENAAAEALEAQLRAGYPDHALAK